MHDHTHTMTFSPDSKLIRLYIWAWEGNPSQINFCKLFWGTLFLPVALFFHGLFAAGVFLNSRLPEKSTGPTLEELRKKDERKEAKKKAKEAAGPNFFENLLTKIGSFFDKIAAFFQSHPNIGKGIGYTLIAIPAIAIVGLVVYGFVVAPIKMLIGIGIVIGTGIALLLIYVLAEYLDKTGKAKRARITTDKKFKRIGQFLSTGYHAVKYRTCPAIVIEDSVAGKKQPA